MVEKNLLESDFLALRNDLVRRDIGITNALADLTDKIAILGRELRGQADNFQSLLTSQAKEFAELNEQVRTKIEFFESAAEDQSRQIAQLNEERLLAIQESRALSEYINKITDQHFSKLTAADTVRTEMAEKLSTLDGLVETVGRLQTDNEQGQHSIIQMLQTIETNNQHVFNILRNIAPDVAGNASLQESSPAAFEVRSLDEDDLSIVLDSGLFDASWYRDRYGLEDIAEDDLIKHYLTTGFIQGFSPSADFDGIAYLKANTDVADGGLNPLIHYLRYGKIEARELLPVESGFENA